MASTTGWRRTLIHAAAALLLSAVPAAAQAPVKVHVYGVTESVADFQKSITNKFAKTMTLVPTRDEADLAIAIEGRDAGSFGRRHVALVVHYLGASDRMTRYPTGVGGGFRMTSGLAAIADETMKLIDNWLRDNRDALIRKAGAVTMPFRIFSIAEDIKYGDAVTKANAAVDLGLEREHVTAVAPILTALLGETEEVAPVVDRWARERVGAIAARSLVKLGAADALNAALSSARSDYARAEAASVLAQFDEAKSLDALAAAAQKDSSTRVRRAAVTALGSWKDRRAVDPLIAALGDREPNVRKDASAALQKLTQLNYGEDAAQWRTWWSTAKGGH